MKKINAPKTSFANWFKQVQEREDKAAAAAAQQESANNGSGFGLGRLAFWRSNGRRDEEEQADVESQGLLPSFLTRGRQEERSDCLDCGLSVTQRFQGFVLCILAGAILMAVALFLFLPMVLLFPAKFALTFTMGSFLFMTAFALLRGPSKHIKSLFKRDRIIFTVAYLGSMVLTMYAALVMRSYVMVMVAVVTQIAALLWYSISYLPHGTAAMKMFTMFFCTTLKTLCYPCRKAITRAMGSS